MIKMKNILRFIISNIYVFYTVTCFASTKLNENFIFSTKPAIERALKGVVSISGIKKIDQFENINNTLLDIMNNLDNKDIKNENIVEKIGSGVIIDKKKGYIITNAHVISDLDKINVMFKNSVVCPAKLVGIDHYSDLALIKIHKKKTSSIKIADSDKVKVGDSVLAIGNPYGFSHTVTKGIISALCRNNISLNTNGYYNFIQTDAAINQGNSGGGLFNIRGELIGINTAMVTTKHGGNMGLGLSIPSNMVRFISHQLKRGKVNRGLLGLSSQDITYELSTILNYFKNDGAIVSQIYPNTPAHKSDLKIGDIITHINGQKIIDSMHLRITISLIIPDKKISINIFRKNRYQRINAILKNKFKEKIKGTKIFKGFGKTELVENANKNQKSIKGVIINDIDLFSPVGESSLKKGDIIIAANNVLTPSIEILKRVALKYKNVILLQILRDKTKFFVVIKLK